MRWAEVVQDCCRAVEMNPRYVKALFRRAKALERLDKKKECLEGESPPRPPPHSAHHLVRSARWAGLHLGGHAHL